MTAPNELRIFISSTFRDLQEEREHLVKKVFPEIRAICRQRGVSFTDIDLRWGITQEEAEREGIIRICLDEVDRCRPYFIGILGHRYGWIPPHSQVEPLTSTFPLLADPSLHNASITEMEIVHGVLDNSAMADNAFFYFRAPEVTPKEFTDTDHDTVKRLNNLKDRIRQSQFPIRENFSTPVELGEWLQQDLLQVINILFPENQTPTPLEIERRAHRSFAASRKRAYIPQAYHRMFFQQWIEGKTTVNAGNQDAISPAPMFITGESGLGKSSLLAFLVEDYRVHYPTAFVIEHYVGSSPTSGSATAIIKHIIEEIRERFAIADEAPTRSEELQKTFPNWLFRAEHHAKQLGISMLIAIDAVNQLNSTEQQLGWLPKTIPSSIYLLISTTAGVSVEQLSRRNWNQLKIQPLNDSEIQRQILQHYLGEFRKSISEKQLQQLTADEKAASPLYLRVVAEELRLHGEHETIDTVIARYAGAKNLLLVFDRVLERLEYDYGVQLVHDVMCSIWASQSGLSETEIMDIIKISRLDLSRLLFAVEYHFVQHDGLFGFSHTYFRQAVENRYLYDNEVRRTIHQRLSAYFAQGKQNERTAGEQLWGYWQSGNEDAVAATLCRLDILQLLYTPTSRYEVLMHWARLQNAGYNPEAMYQQSLEHDAKDQIAILLIVGGVLENLAQWEGAIKYNRMIIELATEFLYPNDMAKAQIRLGRLLQRRGENEEALKILNSALDFFNEQNDLEMIVGASIQIGILHVDRGEYDQAMEHFERSLRICEVTENISSIATITGNIGVIYANRGEYNRALHSFQQAIKINEELGNFGSNSTLIGNMGNIYGSQGNHDKAIDCFQQQINIAEMIGDRYSLSSALINIGLSYSLLRKFDRALESYNQGLTISRELGNRHWISSILGCMGSLYRERHDYDRALECYQQELDIANELGNKRAIASALGNIGIVYYDRSQYKEALEIIAQAMAGHRAINFYHGLSYWLQSIAEIILELSEASETMPEYLPAYVPDATVATWKPASLQQSRTLAQEAFTISQQLSKADTLLPSGIILARLDAADGNIESARAVLSTLLQQSTHDADRATLHYWSWKLQPNRNITAEVHRQEALRLYEIIAEDGLSSVDSKRAKELMEEV